ncbi:MAG: hypothetical protein R2815_13085 [Flavobacteriales bacterium]|nr:hypothetical protein [Flavobacteriales bacterium]
MSTRKIKRGLMMALLALPALLMAQSGSLDPAYGTGPGANSRVSAAQLQQDGKVLIGGTFTSFAGASRNRIARLLRNGSLDPTFAPGTAASGTVNAIAVQPDGKIIIGGQFTSYAGVAQGRIARLNADGSLDATFASGSGFNGNVNTVQVDASGRILVAGAFQSFNGVGRVRVARLNADGSLDASFNPGTGPNFEVYCSAITPEGRLYIGGSFNSVAGNSRVGVARLDIDGSVDMSFDPGPGANSAVYGMTRQPDGALLIGGPFTQYRGVPRQRIARILDNGAIDLSFKTITGFNSWVYTMAVQSDGKILCGGDFTSYNGTSARRIVRLESDGALDPEFQTGSGCNNWVYGIIWQPEGDVVVVGGFTNYNGTGRGMVMRLETGCDEELHLSFNTDSHGAQTSWELIPKGYSYAACSGTGLPNNATVEATCCVARGSYRLRVLDSAGDGIANGGYTLRNGSDERIIDNRNNFSTGSVSALADEETFETQMGTDKLIFSRCDKLDWMPSGEYVVINANPLVSAQYGITNSTSGYEYWFFDPNGSYSFRRFLSHASNDLYGNAELRACHLKVNNWAAANHIPTGVMMNVRVRGRVAGVNLPWGPACRFKIDPVAAACPVSWLINDPENPNFSCGVTRTRTQKVVAQPIRGANRYEFEFVNTADAYHYSIASSSYIRSLNWSSPALVPGHTYQVRVRISRDFGQTWCPYGEACEVTIAGAAQLDDLFVEDGLDPTGEVKMNLWPNPSNGRTVDLGLVGLSDEGERVSLRVLDATGRTVQEQVLFMQGPVSNTSLQMTEQLAVGSYIMEATLGEKRSVQRFQVAY